MEKMELSRFEKEFKRAKEDGSKDAVICVYSGNMPIFADAYKITHEQSYIDFYLKGEKIGYIWIKYRNIERAGNIAKTIRYVNVSHIY